MKLTTDQRLAIINYRLSRAKETIAEARRLIDQNFSLTFAVNRIYYACFYAANALITSKGLKIKAHKAVIPLISLYFVKTGLLDHKWYKVYTELCSSRNDSDYDDFIEFTREDVETFFEDAKEFINVVSDIILNQILKQDS